MGNASLPIILKILYWGKIAIPTWSMSIDTIAMIFRALFDNPEKLIFCIFFKNPCKLILFIKCEGETGEKCVEEIICFFHVHFTN